MRAFVTGATGLLGGNIVQALLDQGHEVRGLVRSKEKAQRVFPGAKIDFVTGDMSNVAGFATTWLGAMYCFTRRHISANIISPAIIKPRSRRSMCKGPSTC